MNNKKITDKQKKELVEYSRKIVKYYFENPFMEPFGPKLPFPNGWCGMLTRAVQAFLINEGYKNVYYVCGIKDNYSHAWIEYKNIKIDLTINQFDDKTEQYIYGENSNFHKEYEIENRTKYLSTPITITAKHISKIVK